MIPVGLRFAVLPRHYPNFRPHCDDVIYFMCEKSVQHKVSQQNLLYSSTKTTKTTLIKKNNKYGVNRKHMTICQHIPRCLQHVIKTCVQTLKATNISYVYDMLLIVIP